MKKIIKLEHISKIEGHAKLTIKIEQGKVKKTRLDIFEGARFFEAIIMNRKYDEVPWLTSRICGVCSTSHLIASIMAVEDAFKVKISEQTRLLRELLHIGAIMQSHAIHLFFMVLPDYLGFESAIQMAKKKKKIISLALNVKKAGVDIVTLIGGRDFHPITATIGGFSRIPKKKEVIALLDNLKKKKKKIIQAASLFSKLNYPKFERDAQYFALHGDKYNVLDGRISCHGNYCIPNINYSDYFKEHIKKGSTAKYVLYHGKPFFVGALARVNTNYKFLSKDAKKKIVESKNPYLNNLAQAVEIIHFLDRSIEILENLNLKKEKLPKIKLQKSRGVSVIEAPRGLLFHDYEFNEKGFVTKANIITPTALNIKNIEGDIKEYLPTILSKQKEEIVLELEKLIRAYDPCISCSTHFLKVKWE